MNKDCEIAWKKFCKDNSIINENDTSIIKSIFEYAFKEGYSLGHNNFKVGDIVRIKAYANTYHQGYENGYCWLSDRDQYLGKITVITKISSVGIQLDISGLSYYWEAIDLEHYNKNIEI